MKINFDKTDALNAVLEFTLEKADYEQEYVSELKKVQKNAQLKGFRKGKTPMAFVKKMYGKGLLAEQVNKKLQEGLYNYLQEENIDILGEPMPNSGQEPIDFDSSNPSDYTFIFDLGLVPEMDIQGADGADEYERPRVEVTQDMIDDEANSYQKKLGSMETVDAEVEEKDLVSLQAEELEGDSVKKDGWANEFSVSVDLIDEEYQKALIGLKKGDHFDFDIYKLEKDKTEEYVKKYLIQSEEEDVEIGNMFRGKIAEIKRLKLAELDQEFFDKLFGKDEVKSKEEFDAKIKENIQGFYDKQCDNLLYRNMMEALVEKNMVDLPDEFLKRWLNETNQKHTEEQINADFPKFKENLIWTLIKKDLGKKYEVEVKPEELQAGMTQRIQTYFGGQMSPQDPYFGQIVNQMMQDKEQVQAVYSELEANKIFKELEKKVKINDKQITIEEYKELADQASKQYNK